MASLIVDPNLSWWVRMSHSTSERIYGYPLDSSRVDRCPLTSWNVEWVSWWSAVSASWTWLRLVCRASSGWGSWVVFFLCNSQCSSTGGGGKGSKSLSQLTLSREHRVAIYRGAPSDWLCPAHESSALNRTYGSPPHSGKLHSSSTNHPSVARGSAQTLSGTIVRL